MKLKITRIYKTTKDKQGNLLQTKDGREYTRLAIQTTQHGKKWISGFMNLENSRWAEGDEVDVEVEQKGEYLNFKMPPKNLSRKEVESMIQEARELLAEQIGELETRIAVLEVAGGRQIDFNPMAQPVDEPELDIDI